MSACFLSSDGFLLKRVGSHPLLYRAVLHEGADRMLLEEAKRTRFSPAEKEFFDTYSLSDMIDDQTYFSSRQYLGETEDAPSLVIPEELQRDYTQCKVAELKEVCREWGLPVSGTKVVLLGRIESQVEEAKAKLNQSQFSARINGDVRLMQPPHTSIQVSDEAAEYLEGLVKEYIQASGGKASSRDIGRYLAINSDSSIRNGSSDDRGRSSALTEMKGLYGGLNSFIRNRQESFEKLDGKSAGMGPFEFLVGLRK